MASIEDMERQDFINTITELKAMIGSLKLTIDKLRQKINSQNSNCLIYTTPRPRDRPRNRMPTSA